MSTVTISAQELQWLKGNISALQAWHQRLNSTVLNSGDTAWMLTSSALGTVRKSNFVCYVVKIIGQYYALTYFCKNCINDIPRYNCNSNSYDNLISA